MVVRPRPAALGPVHCTAVQALIQPEIYTVSVLIPSYIDYMQLSVIGIKPISDVHQLAQLLLPARRWRQRLHGRACLKICTCA